MESGKIGMLWFDNDPKTDLQSKIQRAAEYYFKKYGSVPDRCFVHPNMVKEDVENYTITLDGVQYNIELELNSSVLPNHLWMGKA
jgi:hypothetical protein